MRLRWIPLLLAVVAAAARVSAHAADHKLCGTSYLNVDGVDVAPYPPKVGGKLTVKVDVRSSETPVLDGGTVKSFPVEIDVSGGTFSYVLSYGIWTPLGTQYMPLPGGTKNLCKYTKCPIKKDKSSRVEYSETLPSFLQSVIARR